MTLSSGNKIGRALVFECLDNIDLDALDALDLKDVDGVCFVPFLAKILLNTHFTGTKKVLRLMYHLEKANDMMQLLQEVFPPSPINDRLLQGNKRLEATPETFESGTWAERLRLVASECFRLQEQIRLQQAQSNFPSTTATNQQNQHHANKLRKSIILDNPLYVDDVLLCLFTLQFNAYKSELNLLDLIEILLHVEHGPAYIVSLALNTPERCEEVCQALLSQAESTDDGTPANEVSDNRLNTIRAICQLSPKIASRIKSLTIQLRLIPSLTIMLLQDQLAKALSQFKTSEEAHNLKSPNDSEEPMDTGDPEESDLRSNMDQLERTYEGAITFVIGMLQGEEEATRSWFAKYIKAVQQKRSDLNHDTSLIDFRTNIVASIRRLLALLFEVDIAESIRDFKLDELETNENFIRRRFLLATATLRYFCALRGVGLLKLNQEESELLLNIITCKPEPTATSINFVLAGICTLLVCSSIINNHKDERRAADWIKWLLKEFGDESTVELLNSIAKHYQNNQTNHIAELVCTTVGMRLQIRAFMSKCKPIFTQEAFNSSLVVDSMVEETDIKRSELKYQAPIKDWIYKKIYEYDESLRVVMVGIRSKTMSQDKVGELKQQLIDGYAKMCQDPHGLLRVVNRILLLPKDDIWTFITPFIENWARILDLNFSLDCQRLVKALTKMWWKFNTVNPRELWIMTINSLRRVQPVKLCAETDYTFDDLAYDPLIVLKCDNRVFRNQRLLDIVLHISSAFLEASKKFLQDQIDEHQNRQKDNRCLEELRSTLVLAQTSAAIQILLEYCLPNDEEQDVLNKKEEGTLLNNDELFLLKRYDESVDCICEHLHQVFIVDTNLAKLVHFQTYPSDLLAITTEKIPSMHICLDYIPELLSQPDLHKQVFVIQLTSHLCEKYAITKSLNCAKLCFNLAFTLMQSLQSDKRASFYVPTLPALLRICKVFPILQEDARIILNQIHQVTLAHMAATSSRLSLGPSHPYAGLEKMNWYQVNKLKHNLSLDEALFLTIQKCLLEI